MSLAAFRRPRPSHLATFDAFFANVGDQRRYLLTFKAGSHLVGVPTVRSSQDRINPGATFDVITAVDGYTIPFEELAYAQQLVDSGLRASDGQAPVPEPCEGPVQRAKHEKFAILDSPRLLSGDLESSSGLFGVSVLYLDVDHFEALNTKHSERLVDKTVLPELQKLIAAAVDDHGFAYAEGGDEVVILLPNTSISIAAAFAEELRLKIEGHRFAIEDERESLTLSLGVASSTSGPAGLAEWANQAKQQAKDLGRNRSVVTADGVVFRQISPEQR